MILLTVKVMVDNFKNAPVRPGEFDKAWYRLVNNETCQTLDYKHIKDVQGPDTPSDEAAAAEEATGAAEMANKAAVRLVLSCNYL
jgi:hypothetical protein